MAKFLPSRGKAAQDRGRGCSRDHSQEVAVVCHVPLPSISTSITISISIAITSTIAVAVAASVTIAVITVVYVSIYASI